MNKSKLIKIIEWKLDLGWEAKDHQYISSWEMKDGVT